MRIAARKCRLSGELFEESELDEYAAHLRVLRKTRAEEFRLLKLSVEWMHWLRKEKEGIKQIADILPWFYENQQHIMDSITAGARMPNVSYWERDKFVDGDKFDRLTLNVIYSHQVSNSHVCPEKGTTNWCGHHADLPKSYPGWKGQINGRLLRPPAGNGSYPCNVALNMVGLLTGTGGGGNDEWGYDVSIFAEDWPGLWYMHEEYEVIRILRRLKGI